MRRIAIVSKPRFWLKHTAVASSSYPLHLIPAETQQGAHSAAFMLLPTVLLASLVGSSLVVTACEDTTTPITATTGDNVAEKTEEIVPQRPSNPFEPIVVSESDVDALVDEILKDSTINISALPDFLERKIYRSTIQLTLYALYNGLASMHGSHIFGHEVHVKRSMKPPESPRSFQLMRGDVDESILEEIADRLLANKAINQVLIPDIIERKIYINCLKLVFRSLQLMAGSFRWTVCGHEFAFTVEKSTTENIARQAAKRASSSLSEIDLKILREYARQAGIDDEEVSGMSFFQRLFNAPQREFVAQIHASMYCLMLGIMEDLLANTRLELLTDTISFEVAPPSEEPTESQNTPPSAEEQRRQQQQQASSGGLSPFVTFTAGVGTGVIIVALLATAGQN